MSDLPDLSPARVSSRLHRLEPGLYQLRFDHAEEGLYPPRLLLQASETEARLVFLTPSGTAPFQFLSLGDGTLCRVYARSAFLITTLSSYATLSDRVSLSIERLDADPREEVGSNRTGENLAHEATLPGEKAYRTEEASGLFAEVPDLIDLDLTKSERVGLFWKLARPDLDLEFSLHLEDWGWLPFMRAGSFLTLAPERRVTGLSFALKGGAAPSYRLLVRTLDEKGRIRTDEGVSVLFAPCPSGEAIHRVALGIRDLGIRGLGLWELGGEETTIPVPQLAFWAEAHDEDGAPFTAKTPDAGESR